MYYECVSSEDNLCYIAWLGPMPPCIVQRRDDINMAALLAVTSIRSLTGLGRDDINMAALLAITAIRSLTGLGWDGMELIMWRM